MLNKISDKAIIGNNCKIGDFTIIYDDVIIGNNVSIGDNCVIGLPNNLSNDKLFIGDNSTIRSHSVIYKGSKFKSKLETGHHVLIRENTIAGDNLRIGSYSDIEGDCEVGDYTRIHGYVHVGKGSKIGSFVWLYSLVTLTNDPLPPSHIERPVIIEDGVVVSVNATILPGVKLSMGTFIASGIVVNKNTNVGDVIANSQDYIPNLKVKSLIDLETKTQHPWMNHFIDAYPEVCHDRILELGNNIKEKIQNRKNK